MIRVLLLAVFITLIGDSAAEEPKTPSGGDQTGKLYLHVSISRTLSQLRLFSYIGNCEDQNPLCMFWANLGECEKNSVWMKVFY